MNATQTPTARPAYGRTSEPATPNPIAGLLAIAAILTGGLFAGHAYLDGTCGTPAATATVTAVCSAMGR